MVEPEYKSKYNAHLFKVILVLIVLGAGVIVAQALFKASAEFKRYM